MSDKRTSLGARRKSTSSVQLLPYGVATLSVALALGLTLLLLPWLYPTTTPLFFVAVMVSVWYGGLGSGLLATILSTLAINYFFIEPFYSLQIANFGSIVQLSTFLIAAGLISSLNQSRRSTLENAEVALQNLQEAMEREQGARAVSEAAQSAKEQLEIVLSSINDGFYVLDRNWCFTYVNDRYCEMVGMQRSAILGQNVWELFPAAVDTDAYVQFHRAISEQTPLQFDYFYSPWNCWHDHRIYPSPSGLTVLLADITGRKLAEAALRESEERFRQIAETIEDVFWLSDAVEQRVLYVNPAYECIWGRSCEALYANFAELIESIHPDDVERVCMTGARPLQDSFEIEYRIIRPDKEVRWIRDQGLIIRDDNGQPYRIAGLAQDISDRKRVEDERRQIEADLQQSNERFYAAMQAVEGIVFEWNLQTQKVYRSEGLFQLIGVRAEDALPTREWWLERIHPDDWKQMESRFPSLVANSDRYEGEYRLRHEAGHWVNVWERGYLQRNLQGELIGVVGFTTDISDRKQAENALRESEARFRTMADNISQFAWMADANGWIFWYNQRWFEYTGTTLENMQGWGWQQVHHPDHVDRVVKHFCHSLETGEQWEDTFPLQGQDGTYRWFLSRALPIKDEAGQILRWFGTNTDITDHKQTEEALRESEARFRLMIESAKDYAIFTLDLNGMIASWNSGAERLLGYPEAEAIGCHSRLIFTPEDNEQGRPDWEMQTALTQGRAENERWHVRKDGSRFWGSGLMMPLLDEAGNSQGFVKILQDKTAQRQAGERLQLLYETTRDLLSTEQPLALMHTLFTKLSAELELHCYYNFMVEEKNSRPMLHLRNYDGISEETAQAIEWIEFGEYLCGLVGQTQQQLVFNHTQLSNHPNAQAACAMGIKAYAGQPLIAQGRLLGTLSFASLTRTHFTPAEIELLQSTCDQVAIALERANLTTSLQQQAEQLKQANRIKDEFLAVLSHELRSPLNPILGWSKLLQTGKLDKTKTAQALATIERNAKLQSQLIEDLLDVSRILQGKLSLNVSPVDLVFTIQAAMETVRLASEAKSIQIQTTIEPDVGQVSGDSSRLQQVIWNLLSNAVKFTPPGGRVDVRLERHDNQAQMIVSDTGKGISPEFLPYVFDYFRQEDGATTRKFGGLGLGLAIVRQIVELHGGRVFVESPGEGEGTTFTVRLPLLNSKPEQMKDENQTLRSVSDTSPLAGLRILVVDDEADSRDFIVFVLEQQQAEVIALSSALEAVQAIERHQPDVLLSDIGMPDMDGYMLIRQVRTLPNQQGGQTPAIALTAYAGEIDQQQALSAGFQFHLSKPIDPEHLVDAIAQAVGRKSR